MTSFTKPEVHSIVKPRPPVTWPQVTCIENIRHVVFDICQQTDRHRDKLIAIYFSSPGGAK